MKTNRRDAVSLVKQLRSGDLTAVWVPDPRHEAMRDLTRAREVAVEDLRRKRQQVSTFLLRQGLHYPGERAWTKAHRDWLASQTLEYAEHRIAFEEMLLALRQAQERPASRRPSESRRPRSRRFAPTRAQVRSGAMSLTNKAPGGGAGPGEARRINNRRSSGARGRGFAALHR